MINRNLLHTNISHVSASFSVRQCAFSTRRPRRAELAPDFAGQDLRGLLFPIWPHVYVTTSRTALGAHGLAGERRQFDIVGKVTCGT